MLAAVDDAAPAKIEGSGVFLGIDPGTQRAGVAVSDPDGRMAFPLTVLVASDGPFAEQVSKIAANREACAIVVGLPRRLDGSEGTAAQEARELAEHVGRLTGLVVHLFDERMTTASASAAMRSTGVKAKGQRGIVDKVAAALILQAFLDSRPSAGPGPAES